MKVTNNYLCAKQLTVHLENQYQQRRKFEFQPSTNPLIVPTNVPHCEVRQSNQAAHSGELLHNWRFFNKHPTRKPPELSLRDSLQMLTRPDAMSCRVGSTRLTINEIMNYWFALISTWDLLSCRVNEGTGRQIGGEKGLKVSNELVNPLGLWVYLYARRHSLTIK